MAARIAFLLCLLAAPAVARSPIAEVICAPRPEILARLAAHGEVRIAGTGLRDMETVIEIWSSDRGDWTMVQSHANGTACILAMGTHWEAPRPRDPA